MTRDPRGIDNTPALLVVRVWEESGAFRARVTRVVDLAQVTPEESTTASPTELRRLVDQWLLRVGAG